jgi:hypothetical protein
MLSLVKHGYVGVVGVMGIDVETLAISIVLIINYTFIIIFNLIGHDLEFTGRKFHEFPDQYPISDA